MILLIIADTSPLEAKGVFHPIYDVTVTRAKPALLNVIFLSRFKVIFISYL